MLYRMSSHLLGGKPEMRSGAPRAALTNYQQLTTSYLTTSHQIGLEVFRLQARPLGDA